MALDFSIFDQVFTAVDNAAKGMAMNFASGNGMDYTKEILLIALAAEFTVVFILLLTEGGRAALVRMFESVIPAAVIAGLIFNWASVVPSPIAISDELVVIASGGQAPAGLGSQVAEKFAPAIRTMSSSLFPSQQQIPAAPTAAAPGAAPAATPAPSKSLWESFTGWWDSDPVSGIFIGIADGIAGSFVTLLDVALLIGAFAICWMSVLAANVLIYIGLCFGPLILALSIIGKLRSLMTNWIAFMTGAIFFKPVVAFLIALLLVMLDKINAVAQTTPSENLPMTALMIFVGMLTLSMLVLLMNAKSITQALFGGLAAQLTPHPSSVVNLTKFAKPGGGGNPPSPPSPPPGPGIPK